MTRYVNWNFCKWSYVKFGCSKRVAVRKWWKTVVLVDLRAKNRIQSHTLKYGFEKGRTVHSTWLVWLAKCSKSIITVKVFAGNFSNNSSHVFKMCNTEWDIVHLLLIALLIFSITLCNKKKKILCPWEIIAIFCLLMPKKHEKS